MEKIKKMEKIHKNEVGEPVPTAGSPDVPEWVRFALESAVVMEEIMGIELPPDLAQHHNSYAHGKPVK